MNNLLRSLSEAERAIAAWIAARDPDMVLPLAVWPIGRAMIAGVWVAWC
jgi:hypothetical protein